ncbi:MAG TPA: TIGR02679 family protein, partial [Streptosporangiaceae bacterium]
MSGPAKGADRGSLDGQVALGLQRYQRPEYRRLLAAARRSLERTGGTLTGRISVADPDDAERKAIIGITGVHVSAGTKRMTVSLAALDAAVSRGAGCGLAELLTVLGGPLRDRPAESASLTATRAELASLVEASPLYGTSDWFRDWLGELRRDGTLTRLAAQGDADILGQAVRVLEFLASRVPDAAPIALPALAANITGDTKVLNHGTALATLVLRALALQTDVPRPALAAERRELWDRFGVLVDDLASRVLVLNVPAEGKGLGEWLGGAGRYGTPFQVTLHQLTAHPIRVSCPRIYVCENPAVLRRACTELGPSCPPLVCTEGRPSTAFHRLVGLAVGAGAELWYHGDFDWSGIAIAADVITRYGGRAWRMGASDYRSAAGSGVSLEGGPAETPWDAELCVA